MPERGLDAEQAAARRQKEAQALQTLRSSTIAAVADLGALHDFLFVKHGAYKAKGVEEEAAAERQRAQPTLATSTY